jgi:hypothetical protein
MPEQDSPMVPVNAVSEKPATSTIDATNTFVIILLLTTIGLLGCIRKYHVGILYLNAKGHRIDTDDGNQREPVLQQLRSSE